MMGVSRSALVPSLIWILACTGATTGQGSAATAQDTGEPFGWVVSEEAEPAWTAEEAMSRLQDAVAVGLPQPAVALDTYLALMGTGDDACPGHDTVLTDSVVHGCLAESGTWFEGVTEYTFEDDVNYQVQVLAGDFFIRSDADELLEAGGHTARWASRSDPPEYGMELGGSWVWTPSDTFLDLENSLAIEAALIVDSSLALHGGWGRGDVDLFFDQLTWTDDCDGHPTGGLWIREPAGYWYVLDLTGSCDGCGPITWADQRSLGTGCVDLRAAGEQLAQDMAFL